MRDDRIIDRDGLLFLIQDEYEAACERAQRAALDTSADQNTPLEVFGLMREVQAIDALRERIIEFTKHAPILNDLPAAESSISIQEEPGEQELR